MCMIIDTNLINEFLKKPDHEDMAPIHDWVNRSGRIVYSTGDKFSSELQLSARKELTRYAQEGKAKFIPAERVAEEATNLRKNMSEIKSDDQHVLALARLSQTRLLCTSDQKLMADFRNHEIIRAPRGRVYQNKQHQNLLKTSTCKGTRSRR